MIEKAIIQKSFWALAVSETLDALETSKEGLSEKTAEARLKLFGYNSIPGKARAARLRILLDQFKNPLIFLLLIAGVITIIAKNYHDSWIIFAAAFLNSLLGFYQENKAENALEHLKSYIKERTRVIRENREYEIDAASLAPGDIIRVSQGDRVPADARLIYINDLAVDESILTGESLPVQKIASPVNFQAVIGDQKNMLFSGTAIVQGFANAVVCRSGLNTEIGRIAAMVRDHRKLEQTPLQKTIINFGLKASLVLLVLTAIIFIAGLFSGHSPLAMFLTSVAILVAAVPEGLPVAMTVILAIGVQRLAKKNGVVRKLLAAETLGSTSVILTDKTGTLTQAKMTLAKIFPMAGDSADKDLIMKIAVVNSDVVIENPKEPPKKWQVVGRPLETAVVKAAAELGILATEIKKEIKIISYLPFNSLNKYSASVIKYNSQNLLAVFGAPEILLKISSGMAEEKRKECSHAISQMAHSGERVLGVAVKDISETGFALNASAKISGLKFLGTISFRDPLREGVEDALHRTEQAGVKTVIVTGDHRGTAVSIAKELGLPTKDENIIDGADLDNLTAEELEQRLAQLSIVSRVSPEGKVKITQGFQKLGHIVAMTGDGINDAPSLKQADIGVAMGSGADVAKDIAELVLLDNNYETIVAAIAEGRRIMENMRKVIVYLFSSVADELILIGGALFFGLTLPLNAVQILWVNLLTDSLPAIALAFEDHVDYLVEKPKKISKSLLDKEMKFLIFAIGIPTSFLLFGIYWALLKLGFDPIVVRTFTFASFGTYSLFLIFSVRSLRKNIWKFSFFSNPYLLIGVVSGLTLMALAVYLPFFQNLLGTAALPPLWISGVIGIGLINILAIEAGKLIIKRL